MKKVVVERAVTVNISDQSGKILGTGTSTKSIIDAIRKAAKVAKLNTPKREEKIKSAEVNIILTI
jgi:hypothetical protein